MKLTDDERRQIYEEEREKMEFAQPAWETFLAHWERFLARREAWLQFHLHRRLGTEPLPRPLLHVIMIQLVWMILATLISVITETDYADEAAVLLLVMVPVWLVNIWLLIKLARGRNWVRWMIWLGLPAQVVFGAATLSIPALLGSAITMACGILLLDCGDYFRPTPPEKLEAEVPVDTPVGTEDPGSQSQSDHMTGRISVRAAGTSSNEDSGAVQPNTGVAKAGQDKMIESAPSADGVAEVPPSPVVSIDGSLRAEVESLGIVPVGLAAADLVHQSRPHINQLLRQHRRLPMPFGLSDREAVEALYGHAQPNIDAVLTLPLDDPT